VSWRIYFHDVPQSIALVHLQEDFIVRQKYKLMDDFFEDAKKGTLPAYSFIEPRYYDYRLLKANDQHPPHDVALGEYLIADVHEAIRNSPQWERSLLVILADEEGGIYDHVPPPTTVSSDGKVQPPPMSVGPDGKVQPPFDFTRLGVRVPAVLVSPYIPRGTIDPRIYDHTSLLATVEKRFDLPPLTNRDARANTFEWVFKEPVPRTDAPTRLERPTDPVSLATYEQSKTILGRFQASPLGTAVNDANTFVGPASEFQQSLLRLVQSLKIYCDREVAKALRLPQLGDTEREVAQHVHDFASKFFKHLL
jgi:phospholipase C